MAEQLGVHEQTFSHWEGNETQPALHCLPKVIEFLGYDPRQEPETLGARLRHLREGRGISQKALAEQLGVDPGTLAKWESGRRRPTGKYLALVKTVFDGGLVS